MQQNRHWGGFLVLKFQYGYKTKTKTSISRRGTQEIHVNFFGK